jgi:hypothetical protein
MAANSVENGTASVDYTAYPPPPPPTNEKPTPAELSTAQAEMHKKVLKHFQNEAYKIPGVENGALLEDEKFWLVRCLAYCMLELMAFYSFLV